MITSHMHARDVVRHEDLFPDLVEKIHERLNMLHGCPKHLRHSQAPRPVQLTRQALHDVLGSERPYMVAEKTDGVRALLLFFMYHPEDGNEENNCMKGSKPVVVFVSRGRRFTQVRMQAPVFFFRGIGTLMDGELVESLSDPELLKYLAFDLVSVGGEAYNNRNLLERLKETKRLLEFEEFQTPDRLQVLRKPMWFLQDFPLVLRHIEKLDHRSDGLTFTPINECIRTGTHPTLYKFKDEPTVDLLVKRFGDAGDLGLFTFFSNSDREGSPTLVHTLDEKFFVRRRGRFVVISKLPKEVMELVNRDDGVVLEFKVEMDKREQKEEEEVQEEEEEEEEEEKEKKKKRKNDYQVNFNKRNVFRLNYYRTRLEKELPNHARTVASIMDEVMQDVKIDEIVEVASRPFQRKKAMTKWQLRRLDPQYDGKIIEGPRPRGKKRKKGPQASPVSAPRRSGASSS